MRILDGYNLRNNDYTTNTYDHIDKENFDEVLNKWEPDIVHFTGHGTDKGLLFQYGDPIDSKQLKNLFKNKKTIQLLFLMLVIPITKLQTLLRILRMMRVVLNI